MKTFSFLKNHKINLVIALVLLFIQANCELTLPTIMSDIVDTGISNGGIDSVVPKRITQSDLDDVELFLTDSEIDSLDAAYTESDGTLVFSGSEGDRDRMEGFLGEAEMLAYQFIQGVPLDSLQEAGAVSASSKPGDPSALETPRQDAMGEVTIDQLRSLVSSGAVQKADLVSSRAKLMEKLGDNGDAIVSSRAKEFVKYAYSSAGVDVDAVQTDYLFSKGAQMLGFAAITALCAILAAFNASYTAARVARDLRRDMYKRVLSYSPVETSKFSVASLITRATNDVQQIQTVLVMCMRMVLFAPCMGIGAVWRVLTYGDTGLQWIIVASIAAISVIIGVLMGLTLPKFRIMQDLVDSNNLIAREILTGIMPIRAFGRSRYEEGRYDEANKKLTSTYIFTNRAMSFMMPVMMIIMNLTSVAIVWFGGHGIDAGTMQVGDLMAYMNYTMQVIMSFMVITMVAVMLPRADVASERVLEVLGTTSSISDPSHGIEGGSSAAHPSAREWRGELAFNNVSFAYPGSNEPTLSGVSFKVKPGETLGIIGSTGVGKSTLVNLIPRLYDVTEGSVTIDGVDVREIGLKELRSIIGFVPQKGVLFSGTIGDNIKFGDPAMGDERMEASAKIAQARDFIASKPDGYDSPISQGGSNVSGGQRQRLAIARALAIDPKVLVFDDSFSALDYKTDAALRKELSQHLEGASVVIVAQRIATIMQADTILVLDDGRVVGAGTHEELLGSCPEYFEIASSQLSPAELGIEGPCVDGASRGIKTGSTPDGELLMGGER